MAVLASRSGHEDEHHVSENVWMIKRSIEAEGSRMNPGQASPLASGSPMMLIMPRPFVLAGRMNIFWLVRAG